MRCIDSLVCLLIARTWGLLDNRILNQDAASRRGPASF